MGESEAWLASCVVLLCMSYEIYGTIVVKSGTWGKMKQTKSEAQQGSRCKR